MFLNIVLREGRRELQFSTNRAFRINVKIIGGRLLSLTESEEKDLLYVKRRDIGYLLEELR